MRVIVYSAGVGSDYDYVHKRRDLDAVFSRSDIDIFRKDVMNAKMPKVLSHKYFPDVDWTIWVDSNVSLKVSAITLVNMVPSDKNIAVFPHWFRDCVYDEADECMIHNLDTPANIIPQMKRYKEEGYSTHNGLGMCFLIIRRNTEKIARLNEKWWAEICCGSTRDQLSFPYVYRDEIHYFESVVGNDTPYFKRDV